MQIGKTVKVVRAVPKPDFVAVPFPIKEPAKEKELVPAN